MDHSVTSPSPSQMNSSTPLCTRTVEISVRGKWTSVPALQIGDNAIIARGRFVRTACLHNENWLPTELSDPQSIIRALKEPACPIRADIFTFAQLPPHAIPKYQYFFELESIAALQTSNFDEWWNALPHEGRKNVRRAQKRGVVVKIRELDEDLVRELMELNNESPYRQKIRFPHYGKSIDQVRKDQSTYLEQSDFVCAYFGTELIGCMKLVYRGESASILQFISKTSHYDKRPANAVLAKAIELCQLKNIAYLTYGMMDYGNKKHGSLREFKLRNGFTEMLVPRYYVPLSVKGRACMVAKLHRGMIGVLPPQVIRLAVGARARWNMILQSTKPV